MKLTLLVLVLICQLVRIFCKSDKFAEAVDKSLDYLVETDQAFWINYKVFNISKPENVIKLYHKR